MLLYAGRSRQQLLQPPHDGSSQHCDKGKLSLLELNRLHTAFPNWGQSAVISAQPDDSSPKPDGIPSQHCVSQQLIQEWQPFKDLRQHPPDGDVLRPLSQAESWTAPSYQTFFTTSVGFPVPLVTLCRASHVAAVVLLLQFAQFRGSRQHF